MDNAKFRNAATTAFWTLHEVVMRHDEALQSLKRRQRLIIQDDGSYEPERFLTDDDIYDLHNALSTLGSLAFELDDLIPEPDPIGTWEHDPSAEFSI